MWSSNSLISRAGVLLHFGLSVSLSIPARDPVSNAATLNSTNLNATNGFKVTPQFWTRFYMQGYGGLKISDGIYKLENTQIIGGRHGYDPDLVSSPSELAQFQVHAMDLDYGELLLKSEVELFDLDGVPRWALQPQRTGWKPSKTPTPIPLPPAFDMFKADELSKAAGRTSPYHTIRYEMELYRGQSKPWPVYHFVGVNRESWVVRLDTQEVIDPPWGGMGGLQLLSLTSTNKTTGDSF